MIRVDDARVAGALPTRPSGQPPASGGLRGWVSLLGSGAVLDQGAGGRHEHALVAVSPPHQIRGRALGAVNLGDHTFPVPVTRVTAPDHNFVSHFCAHLLPSLSSMPSA